MRGSRGRARGPPRGRGDAPQLDEGQLVPAPLVADEHLGVVEQPGVEVHGVPRGGGLDAGEAVRHLLALRADDDGHVGDGLAGPGRALLLGLVLQRPRGVRQAGHHEVVHQLRGLLVRHGSRHLRAGGGQRHGSHPDPRPARGTRWCRGEPPPTPAAGHAGGGADGAKAPGTGREEASCLPVTLRREGTGKLAPTEGLGPCPHPEHSGMPGAQRWGSQGAVAQPPRGWELVPTSPRSPRGGSCAALRRVAGKGKEAGDEALSCGAVTVGGPRGTGACHRATGAVPAPHTHTQSRNRSSHRIPTGPATPGRGAEDTPLTGGGGTASIPCVGKGRPGPVPIPVPGTLGTLGTPNPPAAARVFLAQRRVMTAGLRRRRLPPDLISCSSAHWDGIGHGGHGAVSPPRSLPTL